MFDFNNKTIFSWSFDLSVHAALFLNLDIQEVLNTFRGLLNIRMKIKQLTRTINFIVVTNFRFY